MIRCSSRPLPQLRAKQALAAGKYKRLGTVTISTGKRLCLQKDTFFCQYARHLLVQVLLTEFKIASNSMLIKCFSLFVFFYRSLKFAVFLRDCSLRRYCLVRSVREDNIFSILLMRRLAACDWWRPRALLSSKLHSLRSLSASRTDSSSSSAAAASVVSFFALLFKSLLFLLCKFSAERAMSGAFSAQSSPKSVPNFSESRLT